MARVLVGLFVLAFVIGGCTMVGPDYVKPTAPEPQEWLESTDSKIESKAADFSTWWTVFNDPILNALVESAYQQNLSLQVTGIRILEARAQLGIAIGNQYPQTQQGTGDTTVEKASANQPNFAGLERFYYVYDVGFAAAWELDFWGKFRRAVQAGVADLQASIADYDDNLVFLTSEVARTYVDLRTSEERLAVAYDNTKIQKRSLQLAQIQFNAGDVTELDVFQSRALLRSTEATIPGSKPTSVRPKMRWLFYWANFPGKLMPCLPDRGASRRCRLRLRLASRPNCCAAGPIFVWPNVSWPPKVPRSAWPKRTFSPFFFGWFHRLYNHRQHQPAPIEQCRP